jgi:hypothetical protein
VRQLRQYLAFCERRLARVGGGPKPARDSGQSGRADRYVPDCVG